MKLEMGWSLPKSWVYVLILSICALAALAQAESSLPAANLQPSQQRQELWPQLLTLSDAPGELIPHTVWQAMNHGLGERLTHADQSYGRWLPYPYWAHVALHNPSPHHQSWLLGYELPTQERTQIWESETGQDWQRLPEWHELNGSPWFGGQLWPVWRVTLAPQETRHFLLRIDGYNRMRFPLVAMNDAAFSRLHTLLYLAIGFIFAVPCVVALYVLTLLRAAEDKSVPLFLVMAACEMLGAVWVSGLLPAVMPWIDRTLSGWLGWTGYVLMLGLSGWHARIFMHTTNVDRLADGLLRLVTLWWLVLAPLGAWLQPNASRLILLLGGVTHAVLLSAMALRQYLRAPSTHMLIFVGVWLVYLSSGVLYVFYRVLQLPVHYTLVVNYIQGALVASLLGWAVGLQVLHRRRQLALQIEQARDRTLLYASAQHDLMQPLQSVQIYAQQLQVAAELQRPQLLQHMQNAVRALQDFTQTLLLLPGEASPVRHQLQNLSVHQAIEQVVHDMRHTAQSKSIHLRYRPCHHIVRTDVFCLQRIVRNVLSNAIRYTPCGGDVLLACRQQKGQLWLLCWDNGPGMSPQQAQQCFEAFTRFDPGQRVPEGLGLGLYSVRELAKSLGQPLRLTTQPGQGTCMGIGLQLANQETKAEG